MTDTRAKNSTRGGRRDDDGSEGEVEEETSDAKIDRLATEIEELKASLLGVPESTDEWTQIKMTIKDKDADRLVLVEKKRCDEVVKQYFEDNPHILEAVPECPVCLEKMWTPMHGAARYVCCGKEVCLKCHSQGGDVLNICPLCRGKALKPTDEILPITKEKADSGAAWAQAEMGTNYLLGDDGVQKDTEKALSLFREAAKKGCVEAKEYLGDYYQDIENYVEARQWYETAAAEGRILSLCRLGLMMKNERAFDQNEQSQAEAFRLITICATLYQGPFNLPAVELSQFFFDSPSVMLYYLRSAVEGGSANLSAMDYYARVLIHLAEDPDYHGFNYASVPGYSPIPEALFWFRQCSRTEEPDADHPLVRLERKIRENCAHCRADLPEARQSCCVECRAAYYCNRDCQVAHWKAGHKKDCVRKLKKRLRAERRLDEENNLLPWSHRRF